MPSRGKQKFTKKELLFVNSYGGNQTEAARKAGYKNAAVAASRLMSRPHVREAIDNRLNVATAESARHFGRDITFTRNDIIMGLADEAGLGKPEKRAESDSARVSALGKLADIFQLTRRGTGDKDLFVGWTDDELEEYSLTGRLPTRFNPGGAPTENAGNLNTADGQDRLRT
jgi:hypothetical protein